MSEGTGARPGDAATRRALTPAVLGALAFAIVCAAGSVGFVAARGGLLLATPAPSSVAIASPASTGTPSPAATPAPTPVASSGPTGAPTPTPAPTDTPRPTGPLDPLLALPGCPGHPGCYDYTVVRGDSLSAIADRFGVPMYLIREFNPDLVANGDVVRLGELLLLGRTRYAILDPCPDATGCWLYVVRSGDTLSGIAKRYGLTVEQILSDNPTLSGGLYTGTQIRLIPPG